MQGKYPIKLTAEEYKTIAESLNNTYVKGMANNEGYAALIDRASDATLLERTLIDGEWVYEQVNDIPEEYMKPPQLKKKIVLNSYEEAMSFFNSLNQYYKKRESEANVNEGH